MTGRSVKDRHELTKDEKALRRKCRTRVRRPVDSRTTFNLFLFSLLGLIVATSLFSRFLKFRQIIVSHLLCVDKCGPWLLCVLWSLPCTVHGMVQPEYSWSNQHWPITEPNLILNDVLCWRIFFSGVETFGVSEELPSSFVKNLVENYTTSSAPTSTLT